MAKNRSLILLFSLAILLAAAACASPGTRQTAEEIGVVYRAPT